MISESTRKQLLLVSGILIAVSGVVGAVIQIINQIKGLPLSASVAVYATIFLIGVWMLVKWKTRHSRLLKPDALRLDRGNAEHLVGRAEFINDLLQRCLVKQIVFLEGESGSGKSALVLAGLLPKLKDNKSVLPLLLTERWVDNWDGSPFQALKSALITSGAVGSDATTKLTDGQLQPAARRISTLADVERELVRHNDEEMRTPLIIFDQFDDYQARNRERFLPKNTWLDPASLRQSNPFWDMVARLLEHEKLRCLFVTRSDTGAGLASVEFLGPVQPMHLDRVRSPYITELIARLTEGSPATPIIADPDAGWSRLRDRIIGDISEQGVVLPQQLKIMLAGIQNLKWLNIAQYEQAGGASGIEASYVEQQINRTARIVELDASQIRAMLVALIDPVNLSKTRPRGKEELLTAAEKVNRGKVSGDKLDKTLDELERGETVRSLSDPESGRVTYRLDHDYLTRGVSAAERRANRWHYLLEEGAKAFQDSSTIWKKWKALLPAGTQCRLAWERLRGRFRYDNRRSYALISLTRFPAWILGWGATSLLGIYILIVPPMLLLFSKMSDEGQRELASFPDQIEITTDADRINSLVNKFHWNVSQLDVPWSYHKFDLPTLADRIIEKMQSTTNTDQTDALRDAVVTIARVLTPDQVQTLASSILAKIQTTIVAAQLHALTRTFAAISTQLKPEKARALADPILDAIRSGVNSDQRRALGLALAAVASEEAGALDASIVEAIQGRQTAPLSPAADEQRPTPKTLRP